MDLADILLVTDLPDPQKFREKTVITVCPSIPKKTAEEHSSGETPIHLPQELNSAMMT